MFDIIGKRYLYFTLSLLVIVPGLIAMIYSMVTFGSPVRLSIDFTGGTLMELQFESPVKVGDVRAVFEERGFADTAVQNAGDDRTVVIRAKLLDPQTKVAVQNDLKAKLGPFTELRYDSVGPAVGAEVTRSATLAVSAAAICILLFIIFAFRRVPNSWRFGVCATIATCHDILVAVGVFSICGLLFGWEADSLFLTALLTVTGFSVQDTIVVFDRIRENIPKRRGEPFEVIVNRSLLETLHRSLATQLNAIFVLIAILLFGGATIRQFVIVLLYSLFSGTYSSIFNAVPLLVVWEKGEVGAFLRRVFGKGAARASA